MESELVISPQNPNFVYDFENKSVFLNNKQIFKFESGNLPRKPKFSFVILGARRISPDFDYQMAFDVLYKRLESFPVIERIFILGYNFQQLLPLICYRFDRVVIARNSDDVVFSSFKQALYVIDFEAEWVVMHFLKNYHFDLNFIRPIVESATKDIIVPTFNGHPGHPLIFRRPIIEKLKRVRKELGFPYILRRFSREVEYIEALYGGENE